MPAARRAKKLVVPAPFFDLRQTLESGQFFHWTRLSEGYLVCARGRLFEACQGRGRLIVRGTDAAFARDFFALDHDPRAIRASMPGHPALDRAFRDYGRLRILRQDPWECLLAFLLSPASNQRRIQRNLLDLHAVTGFRPEALRDEKLLRRLGTGFRARFLVSAAENYEGLREGPEALPGVYGVGEKVADCVRLFAYGRYDSFPVDVWTRRVLRRAFGVRRPDREAGRWARGYFGPWAGYAQQWLYAWARESLEAFTSGAPARRRAWGRRPPCRPPRSGRGRPAGPRPS